MGYTVTAVAGSNWRAQLGRLAVAVVREGVRTLSRGGGHSDGGRSDGGRSDGPAPSRAPLPAPGPIAARPGPVTDHAGPVRLEYAPADDGAPDPGEIVWAWVPFEENDGRGKDRPVLVIGRDGGALLGLMLSSQDHDRDAADEARHGRHWVDIGTGSWDRQGRPSEARVDRVLRIEPGDVRREGATLSRARFDEVAAEVRRHR
ncbi:type II toxin-antitoxin system PemK/MazF family toxin [Modestobacter muralis]